MELYRKGDASAFDVLYGRYENRLFTFLKHRIPRDQSTALDVFQLTWLKVHAARDKFDLSQKFSGWFYTIAVNTLRDELGEAWRKNAREFEEEEHSEVEEESPLKWAELGELRDKLESVFHELSSHQREALILSDIEGFSSKEIARMMKLTDGAVRQLIFRGRKEMSALLVKKGVRSA